MIVWSYELASLVSSAGSANDVETPAFVATPIEEIALKDYRLDPLTGECVLPLQLVGGADAIVQELTTAFLFWRGAWFLNTLEGIHYIRDVFVKNPNLPMIEALFRRVVESIQGIQRVKIFDMVYDRRARTLTVRKLEAQLVTGQRLIAKTQPFLVDQV